MDQVLVAEDVAAISLSLEDALIEGGYRVAGPFSSSASALRWLNANTPDLALLDLRLSDGPCIELTRILRSRGVPLLFFSGEVDRQSLPPDLKDLPWLEKPAGYDELIASIGGLRTDQQIEDGRHDLAEAEHRGGWS